MADITKIELEKLVQKELKSASEQYGGYFNSPYEAYGVIKEKFERAQTEFEAMREYIEYVWTWTKLDWEVEKTYGQLNKRAILAACECIYVAVAAEKAMGSARRRK